MTWKRTIYMVLVAVIAAVSALGGAVAGGVAVYRAIGQPRPPLLSSPISSSSNTNSSTPSQTLVLILTDIPTMIKQDVLKMGPAVVAIVRNGPRPTSILAT